MTSPLLFEEQEDLLAELGVELPCVSKRTEVTKARHTEWSNIGQFQFTGYVALVTQTTCQHCGSMRENLEGVFSEEVKEGTGARRLQSVAGGQWPQSGSRCEVKQASTHWCPDCIRELGFDREVEAGQGREIIVR